MSAKMAQFDVFVNPLANSRRAYPFVASMQSDIASSSSDQIVAPLAPMASMSRTARKLTPDVSVNGVDHIVVVPRLTPIRSRDLSASISSIASARRDLLAAIDYLFFGA
jgi:toxin CcdB